MTTSAPIHPPAATAEQTGAVDVELAVSGMTCASCAARIERTLNKLDGVSASAQCLGAVAPGWRWLAS